MSVVSLRGHALPGEPVKDVVEMAEAILARAKAGEIVNFAYAAERNDGAITTGWATSDRDDVRVTAAVSQLFWRWHKRMDDGGRDGP